mgnify:CR=1 FL=1|jgi:hypothetical protein
MLVSTEVWVTFNYCPIGDELRELFSPPIDLWFEINTIVMSGLGHQRSLAPAPKLVCFFPGSGRERPKCWLPGSSKCLFLSREIKPENISFGEAGQLLPRWLQSISNSFRIPPVRANLF